MKKKELKKRVFNLETQVSLIKQRLNWLESNSAFIVEPNDYNLSLSHDMTVDKNSTGGCGLGFTVTSALNNDESKENE